MHPSPELTPLLKQLRLSGILATLETRNRQAIDQRLAYVDFLAHLVADEIARREQKRFGLRLRRAGFRSTKTLEHFDFAAAPGLNAGLVHELATARFVAEPTSVLIVGPCGTGKSHLAQALGHRAVRAGYDATSSSPPRLSCSPPSTPPAPPAPTSDASRPSPASPSSSSTTSA